MLKRYLLDVYDHSLLTLSQPSAPERELYASLSTAHRPGIYAVYTVDFST